MCDLGRGNSRINKNENCVECGSGIIEEGDSYLHCGNCGLQLKSLQYDTEYKFPSEVQASRRTNNISDLGSHIERDGSSLSRRLSILQCRISQRKLSYTDRIIKEAEMAGVSGVVFLKVADIIDTANIHNTLTHNRDGMIGLKILSTAKDKSQYRCRVYAAAALEVLNRNLYPNQVLKITASWRINKSDLSKGIKVIRKILLSENFSLTVNNSFSTEDNPKVMRYRSLYFCLENFRDHIAEILDFSSAKGIIDCAIEILSENGEPIGEYILENIEGKFRNYTPQKAAMVSIVDSMIILGFNDVTIQSLYAKTPVSGMKWINSRLGAYRRNLVEGL